MYHSEVLDTSETGHNGGGVHLLFDEALRVRGCVYNLTLN